MGVSEEGEGEGRKKKREKKGKEEGRRETETNRERSGGKFKRRGTVVEKWPVIKGVRGKRGDDAGMAYVRIMIRAVWCWAAAVR